jgi:tetratricopeptide (TPR) repeat protein
VAFQDLKAIAVRANHVDLSRAAEAVYKDPSRNDTEHAFAGVLWAYALLRLDPHRYLDRGLSMADEGFSVLLAGRDVERDAVDWATTIYGGCYQLVGKHEEAERIFRELLDRPRLDLAYRLVTIPSLAHSLNCQGQKGEALRVFQAAAADIDAIPLQRWTSFVFRERQRLRLNLADYYLAIPDPDRAEAELDAVDHRDETLLMSVSYLVSRARIAVLGDDWDTAEELGIRANAGAIQAGYAPLRVDALGVLVAVAGRRARYAEQQRLVLEMAALTTPIK